MKNLFQLKVAGIIAMSMSMAVVRSQSTYLVTATDQTPSARLTNPNVTYIPRYVSGLGSDQAYTLFFEDRSSSYLITNNPTTSGATGLAVTNTATNRSGTDTHFIIKNWPISISGTTYEYRAWADSRTVGEDLHFLVSHDMVNWTQVAAFTITVPATPPFYPSSTIHYGFHDVFFVNNAYYALDETNRGQTLIVKSINGDENWVPIDVIGSNHTAHYLGGNLETPSEIAANTGWTPSGNFFDLGGNRGYGKIYCSPASNKLFIAINTMAAANLPPAELEAAFINPSNWTWNDGTTGMAANPILVRTGLSEAWLVPNTDPANLVNILYTGTFGVNPAGLGYATFWPPALPVPPMVSNLVVTTLPGATVSWYDAPTGGNLLPGDTPLVTATDYFASQAMNGIESTERLAVTAILISVVKPVAGAHVPGQTDIVWNWNPVANASGYKWNSTNDYATATDTGTSTTYTQTGITCNTNYNSYVWALFACGTSEATALTQTTTVCE